MKPKKNMGIFLLLALLIFLGWYFKFAKHYPARIDLLAKPDYWGVTFSRKFAQDLGLDWRETYRDVLDELQVKNIRLPIYWDEIEKKEGEWDYGDYDYMLAEGRARQVKFIANIGWRLPRWPECHSPLWLKDASSEQIKIKTFAMLQAVIERYRDNPSIVAWQVENEPLLDAFGQCPPADKKFLSKEVSLVKQWDNSRPVIISASGELSNWKEEAKLGDIFGTSIYRVVWSRWAGYFRHPWPPSYYQFKAKMAGLDKNRAIISELQAEPWVSEGSITALSLSETKKSFDLNQFKANLQFAINVDFKQAYLWGVEWWYWEKLQGRAEYWVLAKDIFSK